MLLITCPHCGPRNSDEFSFHGELSRRPDPATTTSSEWRRYLYLKDNVAGLETEHWVHVAGCRRFLLVQRDTISNDIRSIRDVADPAP